MNAVVLLSGGLDSAVCLAVARREGYACTALSFDYGQRHRRELDAARRVAASMGVADHRVLALDLRAVGGSALTADIPVPKDTEPGRDIPVTYVPARNLVFLSLAAGLAEAIGAERIYIGVNAVDYSGYPDCRPGFIAAFEAVLRVGTRAGVEGRSPGVETPLIHLGKADIVRLGASLGVDFALTHSCYDPAGDAACGTCESCVLRRRGFDEAGVPDPMRYIAG